MGLQGDVLSLCDGMGKVCPITWPATRTARNSAVNGCYSSKTEQVCGVVVDVSCGQNYSEAAKLASVKPTLVVVCPLS